MRESWIVGASENAVRLVSGSLHRFQRASVDKKALALVMTVLAGLCAYRAYNYWVSGFFVADESGYVYYAMNGAIYGNRIFFGWFNILLFRLFGINNSDRFAVILPFYLFLWSGSTVFIFYKIMKYLEFDEKTIALSLFSSLFLASFVLLSLGFITEPMGLMLAVLGIFFLIKFAKYKIVSTARYRSLFALSAFSSLSSLAFVAARYTREPYSIFVATVIPIGVVLASSKLLDSDKHGRNLRVGAVVLSVICFTGPTLFFSVSPQFYSGSDPLSFLTSFVSVVSHPLITNSTTSSGANSTLGPTSSTTGTPSPTTSSSTSTTTPTQSSSSQITSTSTTTPTQSSSSQITSTRTSSAEQSHAFVALNPLLINTVLIFVAGLSLGWGPILFPVATIGFILLVSRALRRKSGIHLLVLFLSILAIASYFLVGFVFSGDPRYLSPGSYSTLLRFSDSAIPAYFLTAPFCLSIFARNKKRFSMIVAALMIFLVVAVPTYETYASSSLIGYTYSNPFAFGYRTPAAQVRDYIASHESGVPVYLVAWPLTWTFTPGTPDLKFVQIYTPVNYWRVGLSKDVLAFPLINETTFLGKRWTTFYIYAPSNRESIQSQGPFFLPFIYPDNQTLNSLGNYPFEITDRQVIIQNSNFIFLKIQLSWR